MDGMSASSQSSPLAVECMYSVQTVLQASLGNSLARIVINLLLPASPARC